MSALPLMLLFLSAVALTFQSCKGKSKSNNLSAATDSLSDDALMDTVQRRTFLYFWEGSEPNSGLAPERYHVDGVYPENDANVVTSGGSGFGKLVPERMLEQKKTTFDKTNNSDSQNITHPFILTLSVYAGFCPDRRGGLYESVAFSAKICYHFPGKGKTL